MDGSAKRRGGAHRLTHALPSRAVGPTLLLLVAPLALAAAPVADPTYGHYLLDTERPHDALRLALDALAVDETNLRAHRLYVRALRRAGGEVAAAGSIYRQLHEEDPAAWLPRLMLADTLILQHDEPGRWCDEVDALLTPLPDAAAERAVAVQLRRASRRSCPGDPDEGLAELRALVDEQPLALRVLVDRALKDKRLDGEEAVDVVAWIPRSGDPSWLASWLWLKEMTGEGLEPAREALLARVDASAEDPVALHSSLLILRAAGREEEAQQVRERLLLIDPGHPEADPDRDRNSWARWELESRLRKVTERWPSPLALLALGRLAQEIPADGPLRARFHDERADHLWWSGLRTAAVAESRRAYQAEPTAARANAWGYDAALAGVDMDAALAAVDAALAEGPPPPRADGRTWLPLAEAEALRRDDLRDLMDTRGWLLYRLGRREEARGELRRAALVGEPHAVVLMHLGLVEAELGGAEAAIDALGRGLSLDQDDEPRLSARARARLGALLREHRYSPRGVDAWVAAAWPRTEGGEPAALQGPLASVEASGREGMPFPDLELTDATGARRRLSDFPGPRLVEIWATWCGPCVSSLPDLSALAAEYQARGLTVLALSVDQQAATAFGFPKAPRKPAYQVLHLGADGMEKVKIQAIPASFLVDGDGVVRGYERGYSGDGTALRAAIERLLAQEAGPSER